MIQSFLRVFFCFLLLVVIQSTASATHIIGGDLQWVWTGSGNNYQIVLSVYINDISGQFVDDSPPQYAVIYVKGTNEKISNKLNLLNVYDNTLTTNSNFCTNPSIIQSSLKIFKSEVIDISPLDPNKQYYIAWERCCRNEVIKNLESHYDSYGYGIYQNIALTTDFSGPAFVDSSPTFAALENEYFCRGVLNTFNMGATDPDGDHLEYSLVSPRNGIKNLSNVVWASSAYSALNPIPGTVPLSIDRYSGMMYFNPSQTGTFAFGIVVEEYRNGQKIGEVRKDYQFNVQDCPINRKPDVGFKKNASIRNDTLIMELRDNKCFPLYITDVDASVYGISETINLKFNSSYPAGGLGLPATTPLYGYRDTANASICFNPCAVLDISQTTSYPAQVIINDGRCPAQYDTVNFVLRVVVPTITIPKVFIDPPSNPKTVKVDSLLAFNVYGTSIDPTVSLSLTMYDRQSTMNFKDVADSILTISSPFTWQPTCEDLKQGTYDIYFIIKDNSCVNRNADTVYQRIIIEDNEISFDSMNVTNLVTPNGDGKNDYYEVPGIPVGNCEHYFKGIEIYNIWGSRLFYSQDRFFRWYPDVSDGVYYYSIDMNKKQKKGWLQVIR